MAISLSGNSGISVSRSTSTKTTNTAAGAHDTAYSRGIANHTTLTNGKPNTAKTTSAPTTKSNPYAGTVRIGSNPLSSIGSRTNSGGTKTGSSALSSEPANYLASHGGGIASLIQRNMPETSYQMFMQETAAQRNANTATMMNAESAARAEAFNTAWHNVVLPAEQKTLSLIAQGKSSTNPLIKTVSHVNDIALPTAFMEYDVGKRTGSMTQEELDDPVNKGFAAFDLLASIPILGTAAGLVEKGVKAVGKGIEKVVKVFTKTGDDAAEAVTKTVTKTADDAAEAAGKTGAKTSDDAAELAAKSTTLQKASKALATTSAGVALTGASLMLGSQPPETTIQNPTEEEEEEPILEPPIFQIFQFPYLYEGGGGGAENPADELLEESIGGFGSRPQFSSDRISGKTLLMLFALIAAVILIAAAAANKKKAHK